MGLAKRLYMEATCPNYVTSGTYKCPHGYDVEYEDDETPGFRDHSVYNPCPYCKWDEDPFSLILCTANDHNTRKVSKYGKTLELRYPWEGARRKEPTLVDTYNLNEEMFKKMKQDQEQIAWFKEQGICEGKWTGEMNTRWWKWVSDCWLCKGSFDRSKLPIIGGDDSWE